MLCLIAESIANSMNENKIQEDFIVLFDARKDSLGQALMNFREIRAVQLLAVWDGGTEVILLFNLVVHPCFRTLIRALLADTMGEIISLILLQ